MSDGYKPRQSPSGEFRSYIKDNLAIMASFVSIAVVAVGLTLYISSKAPSSELVKLRKEMEARTDSRIRSAIATHESRNAHHGVAGMIQAYAAPKSEVIRLGVKLEAQGDRYSRILKRLDRIDGKIDGLVGYPRKGRKQ